MNGLSWSIYLIGVVGSFNSALAGIIVISAAMTFVLTIAAVVNFNSNNFGRGVSEYNLNMGATCKKWAVRAGILFGVMLFLSVVVPSERTVVLIAASQVGEKVMHNDQVTGLAKDSVDLLSTYMKTELKNLKGKNKKED